MPWRIARRCRPSSSSNGVSRSIPCATGQRLDHPGERRVLGEPGPDGDRAVAEAPSVVGHQHGGVGPVLRSQALADGAPPQRAVEREVVRRQLLEASATAVARPVLAVAVDVPVRLVRLGADLGDQHDPLAQVERRLDRVGQPRAGRAPDDRAVDDDLDPMLAARAQLGRVVEADRPAVDPDAGEPRAPEVVPEGGEFLPLAPLDRRHDVDLRPFGQVQDLLDDLVGRLRADRLAAARTVGLAEPGEEDPEVVVDLGDRPDGRAGLLLVVFCSMLTAGDKPVIRSTFGFWSGARNCRA